jgi:hypothetical protein
LQPVADARQRAPDGRSGCADRRVRAEEAPAGGFRLGTFAQDGFFATHGQDLNDVYRRLAVDVDRILEGARARDLPAELPTRIELVVNPGTAKALGVTIPQSLPSRADGVTQQPAGLPLVDGLATP